MSNLKIRLLDCWSCQLFEARVTHLKYNHKNFVYWKESCASYQNNLLKLGESNCSRTSHPEEETRYYYFQILLYSKKS